MGYGVDAFITGSLFANHPVVFVDGIRSYRDVSVITTHDLFPDRFLKVSQSTCFGDSGGPLFHGATLVANQHLDVQPAVLGPEFRVPRRLAGSAELPRGEPLAARSAGRCALVLPVGVGVWAAWRRGCERRGGLAE